MTQLITILIGVLGGISVGIQSPIVNIIGQRLGGISSSLIVHLTGTVFSVLLLMLYRGENIQDWRSLPWWTYGVGAFGLVVLLTINHTIPRIGATAAVALIIVGQLVAGTLVDHFGWFGLPVQPVSLTRLLGIGLLVVGGVLISR